MVQGQQWTVVSLVAIGVAFMSSLSYLWWTDALPLIRNNFQPDLPYGERLAYAFRCLAFSMVPLFLGIRSVANRRFGNIDTLGAQPTAPVDPKQHREFLICQRNLQNTLEQTVLHVGGVLALASILQVDQLSIIPILVFFFLLGRFTYFAGYLWFDNSLYRAFGFSLTILPTQVALAYAIFVITLRNVFY